MCKKIIEKARSRAGLTPSEALTLYDCESGRDLISEAAAELNGYYFGGSVNLSAPLRIGGDDSESEILLAAKSLADVGHKQLILELPETLDAVKISEIVKAIFRIENKSGRFSRIDLNLSNADAENLRRLSDAGIGIVSVMRGNTETAEAVFGVFGEVGLDTVFENNNARGELEAILMLAERYSANTISISRDAGISDGDFVSLCEIVRLSLPRAFIRVKASEPACGELARTCASQFIVEPSESVLDEAVNSLTRRRILSSFWSDCKRGADCSEETTYNSYFLNSLLSMKEYIADYGSLDTRITGTDFILAKIYTIGDAGLRSAVVRAMKDIRNGLRGARF